MKYAIDRQEQVPIYLQLYRQLRDDIIRGVYLCNTKLPSKRMIVEELGVSVVTVEHAYSLLCDEGYVEGKERSGYFVIFRKEDKFAAGVNFKPKKTVLDPATTSKTTAFPLSVFNRALRNVCGIYGERIFGKSPNAGCRELREALRRYLARSRGIICGERQIVIGSGSEYSYRLIADLIGKDKIFAIETPSYKKIEEIYRIIGVQYEKLPLSRDGIATADLRQTKADVLHLTPYSSYPSGITATASKRHEYLRWSERGDRYLIEDDFASEFSVSSKSEETLFGSDSGGKVIYLNTFTKTIGAGLRIGYLVLPEKLADCFYHKPGSFSCPVPTCMQLVLSELIESGDFERHINRIRRRKRRELQNPKK